MRIFGSRNVQFIVLIAMTLVHCISLQAKQTTVTGFPILAYSHETRLMGGAFLNVLRQTEQDSIKAELLITSLVIYTANKQFQIITIPQFKLNDERWRFKLDIRGRNWPDKYYGIGNDSQRKLFERYTQKQTKASPEADARLWKHLYAGAKTSFTREEIIKFNPLTIPLQESIYGTHGRQDYIGYGADMRFKTTNSDLYPTRGTNLSGEIMQYQHDKWVPASKVMTITSLEYNQYLSAFPGAVLALQSSYIHSKGKVPFTLMPELGARLRAYDSKRYIDKVLIAQRAELRVFPSELASTLENDLIQNDFSKHWGFVLFTELGQVANEEEQLSWKDMHYSNGFGLRYSISAAPKINLRMDFAFGEDGLNFIVQGGEVF